MASSTRPRSEKRSRKCCEASLRRTSISSRSRSRSSKRNSRKVVARAPVLHPGSIRPDLQRARNHEAIEPAAARVQFSPFVEREVDHREPGGREFLDQALARLDIAGGDQQARE